MTTSLHNRIFTETGCVSRDKLIAYTENRLTGKDRHHIERHLLDCPLCMDAVDGFAGKTEVAGLLSDLDARVDAMSGRHNKGAFNYRMLAAAAVAAIILSGAVLWFFNNNQKQMAVVVKDDVLTEKPEPDDQQEVQQKKDAALTETAISASALSRDVVGKEETDAESGALSVDGYASGEATYMPPAPVKEKATEMDEPKSEIIVAAEDEEVQDALVDDVRKKVAMGGAAMQISEQQPGQSEAKTSGNTLDEDKDRSDSRESNERKQSNKKRMARGVFKSSPSAGRRHKMMKAGESDYKVVDYSEDITVPIEQAEVTESKTAPMPNDSTKAEAGEKLKAETVQLDYDAFLKDGLQYYEDKQYAEALKRFEQLKQLHPGDVNAVFYSGMCNYFLGKPAAAIDYLDEVISNVDTTFKEEAGYYRALCYKNVGDFDKAKTELRRISNKEGYYRARAAEELKQMDD